MRQGNVYHPPLQQLEWGGFDLAYSRFLLEHVRDPLAVVGNMVRAVRSGGRIVLADDDHHLLRLWPEPVGFSALWRAYIRSYGLNGNDGYIGRRLVWLLHAGGAEPQRNHWVFFGSCPGDPSFEGFVENLASVVMGARDLVVAAGLIEAAEFDAAIANLRTWRERPDVALWYGICWAEGTKK
jgi:SAM-dependent methyltransferase